MAIAFTVSAATLLGGCSDEGRDVVGTTITDNDAIPVETVKAVDNAALSDGLTATTGQQFADAMAASDAFEIAAGTLARQKATSRALQDFGAMMVTMHTDSSAKLKTAGGSVTPSITPDADMTGEQEANLETLRNASGTNFDAAYKNQQLAAHQQALAELQAYSDAGDVSELRAFAASTIPVVQQHLDKLRAM